MFNMNPTVVRYLDMGLAASVSLGVETRIAVFIDESATGFELRPPELIIDPMKRYTHETQDRKVAEYVRSIFLNAEIRPLLNSQITPDMKVVSLPPGFF